MVCSWKDLCPAVDCDRLMVIMMIVKYNIRCCDLILYLTIIIIIYLSFLKYKLFWNLTIAFALNENHRRIFIHGEYNTTFKFPTANDVASVSSMDSCIVIAACTYIYHTFPLYFLNGFYFMKMNLCKYFVLIYWM